MRIRPAKREDSDEMHRCSMQVFPVETSSLDHFLNILSRWPGLSCVAVDDKNGIVGFSLVRLRDDVSHATRAHVSALVLLPEYQGKGAGRELLISSLRSARAEYNVSEVTLKVRKSNERAIRLYTSLGFYTTWERPTFYPDREDELAMNLLLGDEVATAL